MGHLTRLLNPPKTKKNAKKTKETKNTKKHKNAKTKIQKTQKTKKLEKRTKKELLSYQSHFFLFLRGGPKFPIFDNLAQIARPPKHYKIKGFSKPIFAKQLTVTKLPFLDKKPNPEIPVVSFFVVFFFLNNKKHKKLLKPLFMCFSKHKTENFQKLNSNQRVLKKKNPLSWKTPFLENCQAVGHQKQTQNDD